VHLVKRRIPPPDCVDFIVAAVAVKQKESSERPHGALKGPADEVFLRDPFEHPKRVARPMVD
jgi:hypothetical protein